MHGFFPEAVRSKPLHRGSDGLQRPPGAQHPQMPMAIVSPLANSLQLEVCTLVCPARHPLRAAVEQQPVGK